MQFLLLSICSHAVAASRRWTSAPLRGQEGHAAPSGSIWSDSFFWQAFIDNTDVGEVVKIVDGVPWDVSADWDKAIGEAFAHWNLLCESKKAIFRSTSAQALGA